MPQDIRELNELDLKFYLSSIEKRKDQYRAEKQIRQEIFGRMENEGLVDGYSNDIATVSYKTTKKVEYDADKMLDALMEKNCVRYFAYTILPTFEKDVKDKKLTSAMGVFTDEDVTVKESNSIAVKFK